MKHSSTLSQRFTESVIREMTRVAKQHNAINMSQGFPDWPAPDAVKDAAMRAIAADVNQYAITWGAKSFRDALSDFYRARYEMDVDPERNVTVCCGATEAMLSTLLATVEPGQEVIIFEPFYENYGPDTWMSGATPRFVQLRPTPSRDDPARREWHFDPDELRAAFNARTRAIIINTPNNPTGKVFARDELQFIAELCQRHDVLAITDEIYEFITYDGRAHIPLATLPGMAERTVTISGMSKTFSVTGWRVGYCVAPPAITDAIRKVHDFITVGAPAPLQEAGAAALRLGDDYYAKIRADYARKRAFTMDMLARAGFDAIAPEGAYYVISNFGRLRRGDEDDVQFAMRLVKDVGLATVPGSSFFWDKADGRDYVRFAFCKKDETLQAAAERLSRLTAGA